MPLKVVGMGPAPYYADSGCLAPTLTQSGINHVAIFISAAWLLILLLQLRAGW